MPHTSHRKKVQRSKRTVVAGEDGWARITTTNTSQRKPRPLPVQGVLEKRYDQVTVTFPKVEVPKGKTAAIVNEEYKKIHQKWLETDAYVELRRCLIEEVDETTLKEVDKCFVFGTGTFSGLIGGWIERCHVSLYQLAVFCSVVQIIDEFTGKRPLAFAQEPLYTSLDIELLSGLGVSPIATPTGFKEITPQSFLYAPNAELDVTLRTIAANPALAVINGKLDMYWRNDKGQACTNAIQVFVQSSEDEDGDSAGGASEEYPDDARLKSLHELPEQKQHDHDVEGHLRDRIEEGLLVCEQFKEGRNSKKLPSVDAKDEPFYDIYLYYRQAQDDVLNERLQHNEDS